MGFFKSFFSINPKNSARGETDILWLVVECGKCKETIKVRIDKKTDLQNEFPQPGKAGCAFTLKKEVLGKRCPNLMEVSLKFDDRFRILFREVRGGRLISPQEDANF